MLSRQEIMLLSGAILVTLSCGTIYVFSAYAPQLAAKFTLSSYQLNLLGGSANCGAYLTGPIAGAFVDRFGARQPLIVAAVCLAGGYMILLALFNQPQEVTASYGNSLPVLSVLVLCQFSIGVGSSIGCVGGTNAVAKGLPSHARATSLAATYAGVGLSAFLYSTTAHALFPSDSTVSFLGLLAGGCFVTIMIGQEMIHRTFDSLDYTTVAQDEEPSQAMVQIHPDHDHDELDKSSQDGNAEETREESIFELAPLDISGLELWRQVDFLILFTYGLIVLGTGVLFINNVGTQVTTLYASSEDGATTASVISAAQAYYVTAISLSNCLGRIAFGAASEKVQTSWRINRTVWLFVAAVCLLIGQTTAKSAKSPDDLMMPSILNGMAYGSFFGLSPVLVLDYFGVSRFSTNYGFLTLAPAVSGPAFSSLFGLIYDSHVSPDAQERHICLEGHSCYSLAFDITAVFALLAMLLSAWLTFRRGLKIKGPIQHGEVCAH